MANEYKSGLADQDELTGFPSAANPLTAMGIDPDEARANPGLLEQLRSQSMGKPNVDQAVSTATAPPRAPKQASAQTAGTIGGAGDTKPDAESYGLEGLGQLSASMKKASQAAEEVPTNTPEDITSLSQRREKLAMPAPRFDPKTGKQLKETQEYDPDTGQMVSINPKASTGQKIWRGVRGGLVGALTGGIPGAVIGAVEPQDIPGGKAYNAPSKAYELAEQRREQALGATDTSLENARKNWQEAVKAQQAKAGEFDKVAALGKDLTAGATGLINAENKPETEENKTKAKLELSQKEFEQRQQQLQTDPELSKLSPLNKMLYMANGKVPDPREPNEAEINAAQIARAMTVFKMQHGGKMPQTLEEFNSVIAAAKGDLAKGQKSTATPQQLRQVEDKKAAGIERANQQFANSNIGGPDALDEYRRQLQEVQNAYEADISVMGMPTTHQNVSVDDKGHVTWTPQAPVAPTAPSPATAPAAPAGGPPAPKTPPPGATHVVPGKDGHKHYTNAQGTVDYGIVPE